MLHILILNLGSTSFKYKLFSVAAEERLLSEGSVENIGSQGRYRVKTPEGGTAEGSCACASHADALALCMEAMKQTRVPVELGSLDAIGYKAVHGGTISGSHVVTDALLDEMEKMAPLAPAHNPVYLRMMCSVASLYPSLTQIACFETSFHRTVPLQRAVYGIPLEWAERYGLRRYGFHGSSHSYIAWKMRQLAPHARRVVSIHLGGSSSMCAIADGQSVATSMGATPQSGLFHNNRVGDLDVFCLPVLAEALGGYPQALEALSGQSGFLGLSGVSNDLRDIEKAAQAGDARAELAIAAFADNIVGYIGMFTAYLGGADALAFTGGIGRNSAEVRRRVADNLQFLGVKLDASRNGGNAEGRISAPDSAAEVWVLETNEELMVMRGCAELLNAR